MMWAVTGWAAWALSAVIFLWLIVDFVKTNLKYNESVLISSREGVDELFPSEGDR